MTLYELLLFVHILAAATWVGGAVMLKVQSDRALESGPDRAAQLGWIDLGLLVAAVFAMSVKPG